MGGGQHDNDRLGLAALRLMHSGGPSQLYLPQLRPGVLNLSPCPALCACTFPERCVSKLP